MLFQCLAYGKDVQKYRGKSTTEKRYKAGHGVSDKRPWGLRARIISESSQMTIQYSFICIILMGKADENCQWTIPAPSTMYSEKQRNRKRNRGGANAVDPGEEADVSYAQLYSEKQQESRYSTRRKLPEEDTTAFMMYNSNDKVLETCENLSTQHSVDAKETSQKPCSQRREPGISVHIISSEGGQEWPMCNVQRGMEAETSPKRFVPQIKTGDRWTSFLRECDDY